MPQVRREAPLVVICGLLTQAQPDKSPTPSTTERKD